MFGGDDDLSFVDDVFLQDVLHPSAAGSSMWREHQKDKHNNKIKPPHPLLDTSSKSQREIGNPKSMQTAVEKASKDSIANENDADDSFPYNSIDLEGCDTNPPPALTTPPDSEINQCSSYKFCGDHTVEKGDLANIGTKPDSTKQSDFRSKILQTLAKKKNVQPVGSKVIHNHYAESSATLSCSDRILNSDTVNDDISTPDRQLPSKNVNSEGYRDYITVLDQNCYARTDRINQQHQNIDRNPATTVRSPSGEDIFRKQEFARPSVTPVKSRVPSKRRTVSPGGPVIQKRKFPGPAGLLPQPGFQSTVSVAPEPDDDDDDSSTSSRTLVCSQTSVNDFTRGPWQQMIKDLDFDPGDPTSPVRVFTVKWVLRRAGLRGQACVRKVPFLAVLISSIDVTRTDPTALLKDPTGEIMGTVASSVMDEFGDALQIGSVVVLRGVTVLSPVGLRLVVGSRENTRRHYLNITPNTVLSIYAPDSTGHIITTSVGSIDLRELSRQALSPTSATGPRVIVEEEEDDRFREHYSYNNNSSLLSNQHDSFVNSPRQGISTNQSPNYAQTLHQQGNLSSMQRSGQSIPINQSPKYAHTVLLQGNFSTGNVQRTGTVRLPGNFSNMQRSDTVRLPGNFSKVQKSDTVRFPGNFSNMQRSDTVRPPGNSGKAQRSETVYFNNMQRSNQEQHQFTNHVNIRPKLAVPTPRPQTSCGSVFVNKPPQSPVTPAVDKSTLPNKLVGEPVSNSKTYFSQAEEREVNELLNGLDADSFFEDF